MARAPPVAVALVLVLAGCSGFGAFDGTPTRTLTPVSVPEDGTRETRTATATARPGTETPELSSGDDVERDPLAVVAVHDRRLRTANFTVRVTHAVDGGPTYRLNATVAGGRYRGGVRRAGGTAADRFEQGYYNDGQALYVRAAGVGEDGPRNVSYRTLPPALPLPFDSTRTEQLRALFGVADLEVVQAVDRGRDGERYRVRADPATVDALPAYPSPVRNATVRNLSATVSSAGIVTAYRFSYEGTRDGERVAGTVFVEAATVDERHPPVPDWFDEALSNTSRVA